MKIAERQGGNELASVVKILFRFAGVSGNYIGADGGIGQPSADELDAVGVMRGAVPAMHGAQDAVGAGLQGNVKMRSNPGASGATIGEVLGHVLGSMELSRRRSRGVSPRIWRMSSPRSARGARSRP